MSCKSFLFTLLLAFSSLAFMEGCSSSPPATSTPSVSFSSEVLGPIFQTSCSASGIACHGDPTVTNAPNQMRPYLGPPSGQADAATIIAALMKPSSEDPSMPLVTPGDPTMSYLMQKMDNTLSTLDCSKGDDMGSCGLYMPFTTPCCLPQSTRDTVRAWIAEGAPNN
jgi:hypothetical protein